MTELQPAAMSADEQTPLTFMCSSRFVWPLTGHETSDSCFLIWFHNTQEKQNVWVLLHFFLGFTGLSCITEYNWSVAFVVRLLLNCEHSDVEKEAALVFIWMDCEYGNVSGNYSASDPCDFNLRLTRDPLCTRHYDVLQLVSWSFKKHFSGNEITVCAVSLLWQQTEKHNLKYIRIVGLCNRQ